MKLSICIPNYNKPECLNNCLNSILKANENIKFEFEICISDNCSDSNIKEVIKPYKKILNINFNKNNKNLGLGANILKVVEMAKGKFVWIIGNDDLLLPFALQKIDSLIQTNEDVDFFYINSFNLKSDFVFKSSQPFDTKDLPQQMNKFSKKEESKKVNFLDLIHPEISYDFLLGIFLSVFNRQKWKDNLKIIDQKLIKDTRTYSTFENTCPHVKIFASAFSNSKAFFQAEPLSVNLQGQREWKDLYPFIEIIRIPEILEFYRKNGLSFFRYFYCKNFALRNFVNYLVKIILMGEKGGSKFIDFRKHILKNLFYPNTYLSTFYFVFRKLNFKKI